MRCCLYSFNADTYAVQKSRYIYVERIKQNISVHLLNRDTNIVVGKARDREEEQKFE